MTVRGFEVIDRTDGDADTVHGTVLIHNLVGDHPSIIAYSWGIAEALEELSGTLPDDYERLPKELEAAWRSGNPFGELSEFEAALGVSIEPFKDFLEEKSVTWTTLDGRIIEDEPEWTYPEYVMDETQKN